MSAGAVHVAIPSLVTDNAGVPGTSPPNTVPLTAVPVPRALVALILYVYVVPTVRFVSPNHVVAGVPTVVNGTPSVARSTKYVDIA